MKNKLTHRTNLRPQGGGRRPGLWVRSGFRPPTWLTADR